MTNSEFLALAREALPDLHIPEDLVCEPFGDGPELADELLGLILEGKKTATLVAPPEPIVEVAPPVAAPAQRQEDFLDNVPVAKGPAIEIVPDLPVRERKK